MICLIYTYTNVDCIPANTIDDGSHFEPDIYIHVYIMIYLIFTDLYISEYRVYSARTNDCGRNIGPDLFNDGFVYRMIYTYTKWYICYI